MAPWYIAQTVVPQILHEEVLTDLHEGALGGHFGVEKTLARLKERFYWPGHYNDICDWCINCGTCVSQKTPNPKARPPLKSIQISYIPTSVGGDGHSGSISAVLGRKHAHLGRSRLFHPIYRSISNSYSGGHYHR